MADELEKQGNKAIVDDEYELAVSFYGKAIELDPSNAELYNSRAGAYIKLESFTDAVADANKAIELKCQSLPKAYFRKGIACFRLEEFQTARSAFEAGLKVDPTNSALKDWISKCDSKLREEAAGIHQEGISSTSSSESTIPMGTLKDITVDDGGVTPMETTNGGQDATAEVHPPPQPPAPPKYRHETYQTGNQFVVTFFAKNIKREQVSVDFGPQIMEVTIQVPGEDEYIFQRRLFGKIKPEECKYTITSTKIEVKLAKAEHIKWAKLEYDPKLVVLPTPNAPEASKKYPSSNKEARDWDKLEAEVEKQEKNEKMEGEAALNKLFQDIYKDADEDARRAMNKSFLESNGTVLSTNWKDVGSKEVEMSPPKDMEPKKWT